MSKQRKPNVQEINEIVGKYAEKEGPGVLIVSFVRQPDASYDLAGIILKDNPYQQEVVILKSFLSYSSAEPFVPCHIIPPLPWKVVERRV